MTLKNKLQLVRNTREWKQPHNWLRDNKFHYKSNDVAEVAAMSVFRAVMLRGPLLMAHRPCHYQIRSDQIAGLPSTFQIGREQWAVRFGWALPPAGRSRFAAGAGRHYVHARRTTEATMVVVGLTCVGEGLIIFGFSHLVYKGVRTNLFWFRKLFIIPSVAKKRQPTM